MIQTVSDESNLSHYNDAQSDVLMLVDQFISDQLSPDTRKAYAIDIQQFKDFCVMKDWSFAHPSEFNSDHIRQYRDFLLNDLQLAPNSVIRKCSTMRTLLGFFVNENVLSANPFLNCKLPRSILVRPTEDLTDEEVRQVLKMPDQMEEPGRLHYTLLICFFYLLTRASELRMAKIKDIQFRRRHQVLIVKGKRSKLREIPMTPFVQEKIESYIKLSRHSFTENDFIFRPTKNNITRDFDKPISIQAINYIVKKYVKQAGIKKRITSHSGRATGISHLLENGVSLRDVANLAGHESYSTTGIYDKRRRSLDTSAAYKIDYCV